MQLTTKEKKIEQQQTYQMFNMIKRLSLMTVATTNNAIIIIIIIDENDFSTISDSLFIHLSISIVHYRREQWK